MRKVKFFSPSTSAKTLNKFVESVEVVEITTLPGSCMVVIYYK